MSEEREDYSSMGELPEGLFREREGNFPQIGEAAQFDSGHQLPPDIGYQHAREQQIQQQGVAGNPVTPWEIQPIYDVLPGNGTKFVENITSFAPMGGDPHIPRHELADFEVPAGRVYVFRNIQTQLTGINTINPFLHRNTLYPLDIDFLTVFRGDSRIPELDNIYMDKFGAQENMYLIFGPGEKIKVVATIRFPGRDIRGMFFRTKLTGDSIRQNPYPDTYATLWKGV